MYNIDDMLLLLNTIKEQDVYSLFLVNYFSYFEIGMLLSEAEEKGYIHKNNDQIILTKEGHNYIKAVNKELGRKGIDSVLPRLSKYEKEKIALESIYLSPKF